MADFETLDFYTEASIIDDPYPYFEYLRSKGPVTPLPHHNVVAITGYDEYLQVINDPEHFSAMNNFNGPIPPLKFEPAEDITDQIEAMRPGLPMANIVAALDRPQHARTRSLLQKLFTPSRLRANEEYLWGLSDRLIDAFINNGKVEIVRGYGVPFAGMVIADLLGVPEEDRPWFQEQLTGLPAVGEGPLEQNPLMALGQKFAMYVMDRRQNPRDDILSEVANQTYPDGELPGLLDVVAAATFLFGAGQDTTARLLSACMLVLAENPELQEKLRADRSLIPDFIEETLRWEGPVKASHRLVRKAVTVGGVTLQPGTTVLLLNGAVNRDPRRYDNPAEFRIGRPKAREHVAFGRGMHTCIGAPLARTETRVSLERILDRMADIRIDESKHGPAGNRELHHEPTYILRGLTALHLTFTPRTGASTAPRTVAEATN